MNFRIKEALNDCSKSNQNRLGRHTMSFRSKDLLLAIASVSNSEERASMSIRLKRCCERTTAQTLCLTGVAKGYIIDYENGCSR
jgi:hypothetical protein